MEEDEIDTCAMEVCADVDLDVTGASTMAEAAQRIAPDKTQKSKEDKDVSAKCDDDKSTTSGSSDSSDSEDSNSEVNKKAPNIEASDGEANGPDGSGKDSDDEVSASVACSTRTGGSFSRKRKLGHPGSLRPRDGNSKRFLAAPPSPCPSQKQSALRLNQGPSLSIYKDKLEGYMNQIISGACTPESPRVLGRLVKTW